MNNSCRILILGNQLSNKNHYWQQNIIPELKDRCDGLFELDIVKENILGDIQQTEHHIDFIIETNKITHFLLLAYESDLTFNFLNKLKNHKTLIMIAFFSDNDWRFKLYDSIVSSFFNFNFVTYSKHLNLFLNKNVMLTQWACHKVDEDFNTLDQIFDVTFIGQAYGKRINFIKDLIKNDINVRVFGAGWDKFPEIMPYYYGYLSNDEFVKTIQSTKINLNLAWASKNDDLQIKGRTFEIAGYGGFQLTNYNPELESYFIENDEIAYFTDTKDAVEKINFYLSNDDDRFKMVRNSYERVKSEHLWKHRIRKARNDINDSSKIVSNNTIPVFSKFENSYYFEGNKRFEIKSLRKKFAHAYLNNADNLTDAVEVSFLKVNDKDRIDDDRVLLFNLKFYFAGLLFTSRFNLEKYDKKNFHRCALIPWDLNKEKINKEKIDFLDISIFTQKRISLKYCYPKLKLSFAFFKESKKYRNLLYFGFIYLYLKIRYKR